MEEERRRKEEEEMIRRLEEEHEKLAEEKRKLEEQERRRIEEEEKRQREEEERIRKEEEKRQREEEERIRKEEEKRQEKVKRARKEKEDMERLAEEKRRLEEQERMRIEEERTRKKEKAEQERREEEARRLEKEKSTGNAKEQKENKIKLKSAKMKPKMSVESLSEVTSTNPFDENYSSNPFEENSNSSTASCRSAASLIGSKAASADEKDLISSQREKRPAPPPPGRNQAETWSQKEQGESARQLAQTNKQGKDKDAKTASVPPQHSVHVIAPLSRSPTDAKSTQSLMQSSAAAKPSKRPAPSRPRSVEEEAPPSDPKTASASDGNVSRQRGSNAKQEPAVYGLNPFEDEEDENELTVDVTSTDAGSTQWPPGRPQAADKHDASQTKIKSSKTSRAPQLPAKKADTSSASNSQNADLTEGIAVPDNGVTRVHDPESEAVLPAQRQDSQPATVRAEHCGGDRLQPVKPLNPLEQRSVSVVQGEKDKKSTGIVCEVQEKTKVIDTGLKGPYSQLTKEELISLVLKQKNQLSERDKKISELEQYIDNLLVRVMEEQPSILMSMNSMKKAV
ncbi:hypothetical protein L3Q82_012681 [Scortum barcoo]|uniref:Uncharacterized protein n=1 Tax=Scortum barcoo TaxID=214431 RepID=A0ACB8W4K6_9TELE|nr:hypothetical protein L3Q82_012681 [Scortum barcoo]